MLTLCHSDRPPTKKKGGFKSWDLLVSPSFKYRVCISDNRLLPGCQLSTVVSFGSKVESSFFEFLQML